MKANSSSSSTSDRVIPDATANGAGNGHGGQRVDNHGDGHDADGLQHLKFEDVKPAKTGKVVIGLVVLAALFVVLYFVGLIPHLRRTAAIERDAQSERERLPVVNTAIVKQAAVNEDFALPGATNAIQEAVINARTSGYLKKRYVDIGDVVTAGQTLADIDTPEVDQQLSQVQAQLSQSKADVVKMQSDLDLAKATLARYMEAGPGGAVSQQELDVRRAAVVNAEKTVDAGQAAVAASEAEVRRLQNTQGFQKVVAPFAGRITSRNVDLGSLITAGGNSELFRLADTGTLRIFISVPQGYATAVKMGQDVNITLREDPKRKFKGKVTRTSGSIDPASRTMRVEVQVDNKDGVLLPGMYVITHFTIHRDQPPMIVPSDAVLSSAQGVRVAVIDGQNKVHYQPVETGRNYGDEIEILSGLKGGETIIANLTGGLDEGSAVQVPAGTKQ